MTQEITLAMLKPDCVRKKLMGVVMSRIEAAGFTICKMRMLQMSRGAAEQFYAIHRHRPFFADLVTFMTSGPIVAIALKKDDAVRGFRDLIGATDPAEAAPGTIRHDYADSKGENIVHGSDSAENARFEVAFFFDNLN